MTYDDLLAAMQRLQDAVTCAEIEREEAKRTVLVPGPASAVKLEAWLAAHGLDDVITVHRDLILPADPDVRIWLHANGVADSARGSIAVRDGQFIYRPTEPEPCRLGEDWPTWTVTTPLPTGLVARATDYVLATADAGEQHWGVAKTVSGADVDGAQATKEAAQAVARGVTRALSPECDTDSCDAQAFYGVDIDGKRMNLCIGCQSVLIATGALHENAMPLLAFTFGT